MTPNFLTSIFSAALITGCLSAPSGLVAPLVAHPSSHSVVAVAAAPVVAAAVSEQHHAQDELGQYSYGYSNPLSAKEEVKTVDGITRGGYSYLDSHGLVQSVNYVSDDVNGFRVAASNLPLGPVLPAQDEPVVAHAKAQAVAALAEAAVKDAAEDALKAAAEPLKPIVVAPVPVDAVAVETSPAAEAPAVTATPVVSVASPVSAAAPEAEFVAVTPVPPTPFVTKTYPVYSHPPAAVPVAPLGPVPVHVAPKAVSVVTAGVEVAVTPAPVVASPVPVSAAPVPISVSPAVAYSAVPAVAVTPTPAVVPHPVAHVVAITPAPAFVAAAPAVVKAAPVAVAAPAPAVVSKTVVAAAPAPVAVVAAPAAPVVAGAVTTQHHAQDELGQYSYGYSNPLSAKEEVKTVDGITRGGYSYLDSHGAVQSVNYVSDHVNGFRVAATNLPVQPVHVSLPDSPDVAAAKVKFFAEIAKAKEEVEAANRADALLAKAQAEPLPHAYVHAQPLPYAVAHAQPLPHAVPHAYPHAHAHAHYVH